MQTNAWPCNTADRGPAEARASRSAATDGGRVVLVTMRRHREGNRTNRLVMTSSSCSSGAGSGRGRADYAKCAVGLVAGESVMPERRKVAQPIEADPVEVGPI